MHTPSATFINSTRVLTILLSTNPQAQLTVSIFSLCLPMPILKHNVISGQTSIFMTNVPRLLPTTRMGASFILASFPKGVEVWKRLKTRLKTRMTLGNSNLLPLTSLPKRLFDVNHCWYLQLPSPCTFIAYNKNTCTSKEFPTPIIPLLYCCSHLDLMLIFLSNSPYTAKRTLTCASPPYLLSIRTKDMGHCNLIGLHFCAVQGHPVAHHRPAPPPPPSSSWLSSNSATNNRCLRRDVTTLARFQLRRKRNDVGPRSRAMCQ
jgi:hypothetical protein